MGKPSKSIIKSGAQLAETGQAIPTGKPIMDRSERDRAEASLVTYTLSADELKAYKDKHGWPTRPLHSRGLPHKPVKQKGGKGA